MTTPVVRTFVQPTGSRLMKDRHHINEPVLLSPVPRCLSRAHAAAYLGIGITLFMELHIPPVHIGRRVLYDRVDLDAWLNKSKRRGRAMKEAPWPENEDCIDEKTRRTGGSTSSSAMDDEYARALGFAGSMKPPST